MPHGSLKLEVVDLAGDAVAGNLRIDLRRAESIKQGTEVVGSRVRARIVKNKVAPPFKTVEFDIMFNHGISKMGDLLDLGVTKDVIKKAGAFYSFGDVKLGQGRENSKEFLEQNPQVAARIEALVRGEDTPLDLEPVTVNEQQLNGAGKV